MVGVGRSAHAQALLGKNAFSKIRHSKVLVVGAGGIGCELCEWNINLKRSGDLSLDLNRAIPESEKPGPRWLR